MESNMPLEYVKSTIILIRIWIVRMWHCSRVSDLIPVQVGVKDWEYGSLGTRKDAPDLCLLCEKGILQSPSGT